jgi:large subunit ribosomal protein L5
MKEVFGYRNDISVPRLNKVTINAGLGKALGDQKYLEVVTDTLSRISGQKPVYRRAKKSISAFKVRQDMVVGLSVTLRGHRMYHFVDKLINVTLPRSRDFRGLNPKSFGRGAELTIGFPEHLVFPEIKGDEVEKVHGLEVTIGSNAKSTTEALQLFKLLGFPFKESKQ